MVFGGAWWLDEILAVVLDQAGPEAFKALLDKLVTDGFDRGAMLNLVPSSLAPYEVGLGDEIQGALIAVFFNILPVSGG
jgi:hypothetical protein